MSEDTNSRVLEELVALRAELAALRERVTDREGWLLGWKAIAEYLGYSEDHAKALGHEGDDPIPHVRRRGLVEARKTLLDAWLFRRRVPAQRRAKVVEEPTRKQLGLFEAAPPTPRRGRSSDGSAS